MQKEQTKFYTDNNEPEFAKSEALKIGFVPSESNCLKKVKKKRNSLYPLPFESFLAAVLKC